MKYSTTTAHSRSGADGSGLFVQPITSRSPAERLPDRRAGQVLDEPLDCGGDDGVKSAGFLEEVRRTRDDGQRGLTAELALRQAIELQHFGIVTADDEQRRRPHPPKRRTGEIPETYPSAL